MKKCNKGKKETTLIKRLIYTTSGAFVINAIGTVLGVVVSWLTGKMVGSEGIGLIGLSNRIVNIILLLGLFGSGQYLVKNVSLLERERKREEITGLMNRGIFVSVIITTVLLIFTILGLGRFEISALSDPQMYAPMNILLAGTIWQVIYKIYGFGLVGKQKVVEASILDPFLGFLIISSVLGCLTIVRRETTITEIALVYLLARTGTVAISHVRWKRTQNVKGVTKIGVRQYIGRSMPYFIGNASFAIVNNSDLIIIGMYCNVGEVGIYSVASQIALLTRILLLTINTAISPQLSVMYKGKQKERIELLLRKATLILLGISVIIGIVVWNIGQQVLTLWGEEFKYGYSALVILTFGQLFNLVTGISGQVLLMCGAQKIWRNIQVGGMVLYLLMMFMLVSKYGIIGAAIAKTCTIIGGNVAKLIAMKVRLGIKFV